MTLPLTSEVVISNFKKVTTPEPLDAENLDDPHLVLVTNRFFHDIKNATQVSDFALNYFFNDETISFVPKKEETMGFYKEEKLRKFSLMGGQVLACARHLIQFDNSVSSHFKLYIPNKNTIRAIEEFDEAARIIDGY